MNKKGKYKKGKVPNPSPSQEQKSSDKTEELGVFVDLEKTGDLTENVEPKVESVKEERVPEILSEIITPSVDTKDEETPKKPKRNRGKKKKGKEDDFDDNLEELPKESAAQPPVEEIKIDTLEIQKESIDTTAVTPTARKKKNKKKNTEQKIDEHILAELENIIPATNNEEIIQKLEVTSLIEENIAQPEPVEQDSKLSKKKNKKKKRNDSEKSEKEEISCTSAFLKLIEVKNEASEVSTQEKIEDSVMPVEIVEPQSKTQPSEKTIFEDTFIMKVTEAAAEITPLDVKEIQQSTPPETKNKKKNKKDKKQPSKPDESVPVVEGLILQMPELPTEKEILTENILKEEVPNEEGLKVDVLKEIILIEKPLIPETPAEQGSPKSKAKIAKPVEKKRKGKHEADAVESLVKETVIAELTKIEELPSPTSIVLESPELTVTDKEITTDVELKNVSQVLPSDIPTVAATASKEIGDLTLLDFEPLNLTDKAMGKKRKKGPKIPKTPDVSFEILESRQETDQIPSVADVVEIGKELPTTCDTLKDQHSSEISIIPIKNDPQTSLKPSIEPLIETKIKDHTLLTPEIMGVSAITSETEDTQLFEVKTSKKRKKSPKPPKKTEPVPECHILTSMPVEESLPKSELTKEMGEKIDPFNITKMYDVEISSIKVDESEPTSSDTVPDVTYPRASSQQSFDNNNNRTVISEIINLPEMLPNVSTQATPKVDTFTMKEHNVSPSKEEKTDIKSKMMEVNQDMEELRLSIERSLAELTAMEKGEKVLYRHQEAHTEPKDIPKSKDDTQKKDEQKINIERIDKPSEDQKPADIIQHMEELQILPEKKHSTKDKKQKAKAIAKTEKLEIPVAALSDRVTTKETDIKQIVGTKSEPASLEKIEEKPTETLVSLDTIIGNIASKKQETLQETLPTVTPVTAQEIKPEEVKIEKKDTESIEKDEETQPDTPPVCPARKDQKGKNKKKKGKQDSKVTIPQPTQTGQGTQSTASSQSSTGQEVKKEEKSEKSDSKNAKDKGKQQVNTLEPVMEKDFFSDIDYEPIENFEDALTSSVDDVNKTFEIIVQQSQEQSNPSINITAPDVVKTPVSPPKNLLGHPDIPVPSNRRDYKKEKDKIPNEITATVDIKDAVDVERKQSKNTQTISKMSNLRDCRTSDNEEFVYKYSFRKVFLQSSCHVCKKELGGSRVACCYCNLVFYCGIKHKDEDWPQHQALCFAVSTIGHLKDQKHIYGDAKNITGHDYRLVRMQMIVSCEKVLKRRLVPWEQEALLYPRICAHIPCREWRQMKLTDCEGCGQISYCIANADHYPKTHSRWCKSYSLYQKLVSYQQTLGRLEPRLPTKVMQDQYEIPEKINEVLASMYEEKIDLNDIQYAALTQLATAPLTAAYCYQLYRTKNITVNGYKKASFTIHVVGAELQFEADALNKWEVFFLHLRPDLQEVTVVLINNNLNPSNLPLELLGKVKVCADCRLHKRRVLFSFQDQRTYAEYKASEDFIVPDIVCAFNPGIQRSSVYNGKDPWPSNVSVILKQKIPFIITAYTITELHKDCIRIKECAETGYTFVSEPKNNNFASVRPDRNFISDDEIPLLFKNYCYAIICG